MLGFHTLQPFGPVIVSSRSWLVRAFIKIHIGVSARRSAWE
jgi:hypothetical protein